MGSILGHPLVHGLGILAVFPDFGLYLFLSINFLTMGIKLYIVEFGKFLDSKRRIHKFFPPHQQREQLNNNAWICRGSIIYGYKLIEVPCRMDK